MPLFERNFFHSTWRHLRNLCVRCGLSLWLLRFGRLGLYDTRRFLAQRHLGSSAANSVRLGLEIGAWRAPLPLPHNAAARYVDKRMPDMAAGSAEPFPDAPIIAPHILADAFKLTCIQENSQDFVIANHVLEHASDALGALAQWLRLLRPQGILFVAVPLGEHCFDRGRAITPLEHFLDDYRYTATGDMATMRRRNLAHVEDHLSICVPAIARERGEVLMPMTPQNRAHEIERLLGQDSDLMHHHVFSVESFSSLLTALSIHLQLPAVLIEVARSHSEVIGIVKKTG